MDNKDTITSESIFFCLRFVFTTFNTESSTTTWKMSPPPKMSPKTPIWPKSHLHKPKNALTHPPPITQGVGKEGASYV